MGGLVVETLMEKLWDQFTEEKDEAMRDRDSEGDSVDGKSSLDGESGLYPHLASPRHGDGGEFILPTTRVTVTVVGAVGGVLVVAGLFLPDPTSFPDITPFPDLPPCFPDPPTSLSGPPPLRHIFNYDVCLGRLVGECNLIKIYRGLGEFP